MLDWKIYVAACTLLFCFCQSANAGLVTLDLTTDSTVETAGEALENGAFTVQGLTITVSPGFNAIGSNAGIGSGAEIDFGETLVFTFSGAEFDVVSIDMNGVGSAGGGDAALVDVNGTVFTLETGAPNFLGSPDLWTPEPSIALPSGATITFNAETSFGLQAITLNIAAIPEPTAALFGSLITAALSLTVARRRRCQD